MEDAYAGVEEVVEYEVACARTDIAVGCVVAYVAVPVDGCTV
jgi:hypothetical protein